MEDLISKIKQYRLFQFFTIALRYLLGSSFVFASIFKIQGIRFTPASAENKPINSTDHFFEVLYQSGFYWNFIGWGQLIVGFLLMSQIYSTIGAVAFFPIMLNIFVITISFDSTHILIITFLMLLSSIYLLIWDWNKLKFITLSDPQHYIDDNNEFSKRKIWTYLGFVLFVMVIFIRKVILV